MEAAAYPDWSSLPEDLVAMVMRALAIPDLLRAGAVCTSWNAAYSAVRRVRIPITDASPCMLCSCAGDDADTATICSVSAGAAFKVRLPPPAFRTRYVVGSSHGWVVAADEASNLQAFNPLTGAQVDLPPATGLHNVESSSDDHGLPVYNLYDAVLHPDSPDVYSPPELRLYLYYRVYLSCSPSAGRDCIFLLLHRPNGELSFARVGDDRWTWVTQNESIPWNSGYRCVAYNKVDGLFYVLSSDGSIFTFDLSGPSPVARKILQGSVLWDNPMRYIVFTPCGDILHIWRNTELRLLDTPVQYPSDHAQEVIDPYSESYTDGIEVHKVDIRDQKLLKMSSSDLREHTLFLGFNSTMLISTKDFPKIKPNCAYLTDDNSQQFCVNVYGHRDVGIWDFETETLESFGDVQSLHPWLNWPPPIWITPSLS
ncbi:hypothetical protein ACP70R_007459 [Stipagrostis hirtigluma subsp. patula]